MAKISPKSSDRVPLKHSTSVLLGWASTKSKHCTHLVTKDTQYKILPAMAMCFIAYHSPTMVFRRFKRTRVVLIRWPQGFASRKVLSLGLVCNFFWNIRDNPGYNCRHAEHNVLLKVTRNQIRNTAFILFCLKPRKNVTSIYSHDSMQ